MKMYCVEIEESEYSSIKYHVLAENEEKAKEYFVKQDKKYTTGLFDNKKIQEFNIGEVDSSWIGE